MINYYQNSIFDKMQSPIEQQCQSYVQLSTKSKQKQSQTSISSAQHFSNFPNGFANKKFFDRFLHSQYVLATCLSINLMLILVYLDLINHQLKEWVLIWGYVFHFLCIMIMVINHQCYNEWKIKQSGHFQTKKTYELIIQILMLVMRPMPFLEQVRFQIANTEAFQSHKVNHILLICNLSQLFLIFPIFFILSAYQRPRSHRICQMYGCRSSYIYTIKSLFKKNATLTINIIFFIWMFIIASAFRIAQFQYNHYLNSFENSLWLTFITMVCVGYGDIAPMSYLGQMVGFFCMYSGVLITSILIIIINNAFVQNQREKRSLRIFNNLQLKSEIRLVGAQYLRQCIWRIWLNKKAKAASQDSKQPTLKQRKLRQEFKKLRNQGATNLGEGNLRQQFKENFEKTFGYLDSLNENHDRLINYLHTQK